jgi:hypothetical protein
MNHRFTARGALVLMLFSGLAPVSFAQDASGAKHGDRRNDPQFAACKKQADDQKLERGPERRAFMEKCMKSDQGGSNGARGDADGSQGGASTPKN